MSNSPDIIPSEPAELRAFTVGLLAELKNRDLLIEKLRHQVAGQNTHRFGSKAEGIDQLQLRLEDDEVAEAAAIPLKQGVSETLCMRVGPCEFHGSFVEPFWI